MFLVLGSQDLDTTFRWVSLERKDYLPLRAGETYPNATQKAVGLLCQRGVLLGHGPLVLQDSKVSLC